MQIVHVFHSMSIWWVCMCVCLYVCVVICNTWKCVIHSVLSNHQFNSVVQSCLTLCNPMDYNTPPHPSPTPGACSNSCPSGLWCHLSSPSPSAFNLSQHQGLFKSQFFPSGGQSIGVSASASVLPMNIQSDDYAESREKLSRGRWGHRACSQRGGISFIKDCLWNDCGTASPSPGLCMHVYK